ncbi:MULTISPECIES: LPXTG cell wall anchor domain-containing protein [Lactobacillus]|uniref:LPXTG cell wall anchor domain-containing protein n=1 Tax=Lactobacillus TaxID=1578 RepID=UPI000FD76369|nr:MULTISPECIES: LPXTG cell wall anchor domain-containing protein [Lactobacillus]RVU72339.1 LPXTG cell wall anchor domain-containing protein [Lactobacillus xujianguonis]
MGRVHYTKLPETDEKQNKVGIFGLALAAVAGLVGLAIDRKHEQINSRDNL